MTKHLPENLTSYDLLKGLAVLLMIVDHLGYFFFPEEVWLRLLGRLCVPVWFFLIGYAKTRSVPALLWAGAAAVMLSSLVSGEYLLPLNILFGLALTRLWIDRIMARALRSYDALAGMFFLLLFTAFPSGAIIEYGTIGVMFAMLGYMRAHEPDLKIKKAALFLFALGSALAYILSQMLVIAAASGEQFLWFCAGLLWIYAVLFIFTPREFPAFSQSLAGKVTLPVLKLFGRRTLEIYVIHLLLFRGLAMALNPERFSFMDFELIVPFYPMLFGSPFIGTG